MKWLLYRFDLFPFSMYCALPAIGSELTKRLEKAFCSIQVMSCSKPTVYIDDSAGDKITFCYCINHLGNI